MCNCDLNRHGLLSVTKFLKKVKVKLSLYRPIRVQRIENARISRQSTHEGGKVSPTHRPPLSTRENPWCSFLLLPTNPTTIMSLF
jgi:hypothetical protein